MNPLFTFVLGLLIGWLIEWVIDYFYWRGRYATQETVRVQEAPMPRPPTTSSAVRVEEPAPPVPITPDNLQVIKGIGKVIERKLNDACIYTYEQLGNLTPADLRKILGNVIERLSDEESLLKQARDLAQRK